MTSSGGLPHQADATDLDRWADTRSAQGDLPILVRRLIRAENDQVIRLEVRGGDGVGLPGYDGMVEATRASPFVPEGSSVWEMGVGGDPEAKAQSDYRSRTDNPRGVDKAATTFVFVTPRRWDTKKDWEQRRRAEGQWRDVRVLDADDIEVALEGAPAVRIWLSELLGMDPFGATSIEDWWSRFSRAFDPTLTPEIVLAGRDDEAATFVRRISQDIGHTLIRAASIDDGLAFAACSMLATDPEQAEVMLSRSLLVHDGVTLRRLDRTTNLLILLPYEEHLNRDAHLVENHHVIIVIIEPGGDVDIELPPLDHLVLQAAFRTAHVPELDIDRYVRAANKSLIALRRVATRFGGRDPEEWSTELADRSLRRTWLAGAWSHTRSGDADVLEAFIESSSDDLAEKLDRAARQADPLFTRVGRVWAVAAPEDSWRTAREFITESDLEGLERAVQTVLGAIDPRLELPAEDRWAAEVYGKARVHSSDLRRGLGRSLALLGARGDEARLPAGRTARQWTDFVVWNLLNRANDDESAQLWQSLEDVLPLLAEAAPDAFLRTLSVAASGPDPLARKFFQDDQHHWSVSSPHTGLLWALEGLAWSDRYLGYVAEILASLDEIDPGGRLSNRPMATLESIFRPMAPQTSAALATRIQTLDALVRRHEEVVWRLLLRILPGPSGVALNNYRPQFRGWAGSEEPAFSEQEFSAAASAVAERVLRLTEIHPARWAAVIPIFDQLPADYRQRALVDLGSLPDSLGARERLALWEAIGAFVRRHREFADARWAISEDWLSPMAEIADRIRPHNPRELHRWLFDEWTPDIGVSQADDLDAYDAALAGARQEAVEQILEIQGMSGIVEFVAVVELPWAVGSAMAHVNRGYDIEVIDFLDNEDGRLVHFAEGYARARLGGAPEATREWADRFAGRELLQARLLQTISDVQVAWGLLTNMGPDVESAYWSEFSPYGRGSDFGSVNEAARRLIQHGRTAIAVDMLSIYTRRSKTDPDPAVIIDALDHFDDKEDPEAARVSDYDISRLLEYLNSREVDESTIARFEWKFLPLLHDQSRTQALQATLAKDPQLFADLIEIVFKPSRGRREANPSPASQAMASKAYRLLHEWRIVPGTRADGSIDREALFRWVDATRDLLKASDRLKVGEVQIGEVLAHAPEDADGTFPTLPVRDLLEVAPNDRLVRGFTTGLFNKRGVTSRGMTEGGAQEYALARKYEEWANAVEATHPRTAAALRDVASGYRDDGRRNDEEARRFLEGLDR